MEYPFILKKNADNENPLKSSFEALNYSWFLHEFESLQCKHKSLYRLLTTQTIVSNL